MSYFHALYLDSFQTTKRHSYDGYSIYIAIFSVFHGVVYPVGMTTIRSCFKRIIGYNFRTIHWICTKCDTRIRLWTPFLCAKFQGEWDMRLCFIANFCKCAKTRRRKKNQEKESKLWQLVSRKLLERFPSHLVCRLPLLANNFVANLVLIG